MKGRVVIKPKDKSTIVTDIEIPSYFFAAYIGC
jgi:hypothetical protein